MARMTGPDQSERVFYYTSGTKSGSIIPAGTPVPLYADPGCTQPADVRALDGSAISGQIPTVYIDATLEVPLFQFPDVTDPVVYTQVLADGPVVALHPATDDLFDSLRTAVAAAVAGAAQRSANLSDLSDAASARANLGLGSAATKTVGTGPTQVAAGDAPAAAQLAASLTARRVAKSAQGALTISWDDGWLEQYVNLWPRLRDVYTRQCHTICVTPGLLNSPNGLYCSPAQVQEIANSRLEIASHSQNHTLISTQDVATRIGEYDNSKVNLEAMIGKPITSFAYPNGQAGRNTTTDRELWLRYSRIMNAGLSAGNCITPLSERMGMFMTPRPAPWISSSHQDMLNMVRLAAAQPVIVNLYSHRPGTDMTLAELDELLTLVETLDVPVLNMRDAYPASGVLVNPGAEDGATGWGNAQSGTGNTFTSIVDTPDVGLNGTKSFRLSSPSDTNFIYAYQIVPAVEGKAYTLSGRARVNFTSGAGYARLRMQPIDMVDANIGGTFGSADITSTSWAPVSVSATMPANTRAVRIDMILLQKTGEALFDHLHFGLTRDGIFG